MRFWKSKGRASAVKFALAAPLLLLMLLGTIEYSRLFWVQHALNETATATARCMALPQLQCALDGSTDQAKTAEFALQSARGLAVSLEPGQVSLNPAADCQGQADFSVVTLTAQFESPLTWLVYGAAGGPLISAQACYPNYTS